MNPDRSQVLVQPIVVARSGTHLDTIRATAQASVAVFAVPHDHSDFGRAYYEEWLAGPFTKTVRRASAGQVDSLIAWADAETVPYAVSRVDDSVAVAFPPMSYAEMPRRIAKLRVDGTDFPRATASPTPGAPVLAHVDESLTTGKAAAAAAHAAWAWMLPREHSADSDVVASMTNWEAAGHPVAVILEPASTLAQTAALPGAVPIIDSGLTEVAPSTLTAVATTA